MSVCSFRVDGKPGWVFKNPLGLAWGWAWLLLAGMIVACNPAPTRVLIEWTTATEINTAGFNLYRSESREGPYAKINPELIPASLDPLTGGKYRYEDTQVNPGQTYYYRLEDVERNAATTQHGPIVITAPAILGFDVLAALGFVVVSAGLLIALVLRRRQR